MMFKIPRNTKNWLNIKMKNKLPQNKRKKSRKKQQNCNQRLKKWKAISTAHKNITKNALVIPKKGFKYHHLLW